MKKYILIMLMLLISIFSFANTIKLHVYFNNEAIGDVYFRSNGNIIPNTAIDPATFNNGETIFTADVSNYDIATIRADIFAQTSYGAQINTWVDDFSLENDGYYHAYYQWNFWHPQPLSVFINPNAEVSVPILKIYDGLDNLLETRSNFTLTVGDWNEIHFDDLFPGGYGGNEIGGPTNEAYENCYATIVGISQYGQTLQMQTSNNFVYNTQTDQWENNNELALLFDFYHNFKESVEPDVNINNATFTLKSPGGTTVATQTANLTGNHITTISFDNIVNHQGLFNPAEYKLYYDGTSVVNETLSKHNDNNLNYNSQSDFYYNDTYTISYTQSSETKTVHKGWNWVSFPRLTALSQDAIWVLDPLTPDVSEIQFVPGGPQSLTYNIDHWVTPHSLNYLLRIFGYKMHMNDDQPQYDLTVLGTQESPDTTVPLFDEHENWVGYWLPVTQKWQTAFGNGQLDHINSIKAEDWYVYKKHGQWYGMVTPDGGTFEYGKAYVISVDQDFDLEWWHGSAMTPYVKNEAEDFTYEEKADYQMIEIESIENGNDVTEVGVYQGDTCVGASKVESYPVHLMAYTDAVNKDDQLSFEIVTSDKGKKRYDSVLSYNFETEKYEAKNLHANREEFMLIKLDKEGNPQAPEQNVVTLDNYPNPFNPTTTISYQIPATGNISLEIYNVKGQLVKSLYRGMQNKGTYDVIWNGTDNNNKKVSSGVYMYKLITKDKSISKKMLMLK